MIWSCKVYYVDPSKEIELKDLIFKNRNIEYIYDKRVIGEKEEELKIYIDKVSENCYGPEAEVSMDHVIWLQRRRKRFPAVITVGLALQYFMREPIRGYLGIFGSQEIARRFISNFLKFAEDERGIDLSISDVRFLLSEKSRELTEKVEDLTKFKVSKVRDLYVASASITGWRLQEADVYHRWVERPEMSGKVERFGITLDDRTFVLANEGVIYTAQGKEKREPEVVYKILSILREVDALHIQVRLTGFL